jgi:cytochrome c553
MTVIGLAASALFLASPVARAASADENWAQYCAKCHGKDGAAHSKMAHRLGVKDLTDAAYQKSFTDLQLFSHLKTGETGSDGKVKMNPFGDKLTDDETKALVGFVRALAPK